MWIPLISSSMTSMRFPFLNGSSPSSNQQVMHCRPIGSGSPFGKWGGWVWCLAAKRTGVGCGQLLVLSTGRAAAASWTGGEEAFRPFGFSVGNASQAYIYIFIYIHFLDTYHSLLFSQSYWNSGVYPSSGINHLVLQQVQQLGIGNGQSFMGEIKSESHSLEPVVFPSAKPIDKVQLFFQRNAAPFWCFLTSFNRQCGGSADFGSCTGRSSMWSHILLRSGQGCYNRQTLGFTL